MLEQLVAAAVSEVVVADAAVVVVAEVFVVGVSVAVSVVEVAAFFVAAVEPVMAQSVLPLVSSPSREMKFDHFVLSVAVVTVPLWERVVVVQEAVQQV